MSEVYSTLTANYLSTVDNLILIKLILPIIM